MKTTIREVAIRGVVGAVPGDPVPIASLASNFTTKKLRNLCASVGLDQVYRCTPEQTAGDPCLAAARQLHRELRRTSETIDGVFEVTRTPDYFVPTTACIIRRELNLKDDCIAFDIGMSCSGYGRRLGTAEQFNASGNCKRVLLLAGDTIIRLISSEDKSVSVLFGDAGSPSAREHDPEASPIAFVGGSDGGGAVDLIVPAGVFRSPTVQECESRCSANLYMDGISVFNFVLKRILTLLEAVLTERGWKPEEVDLFLIHQPNALLLKSLAKKLAIEGRLPLNVGKYGNTSMTSIRLPMADEVRDRVISGMGRRLSWSSSA
jgi:3-oxoacyl-[acyl-carrier-protein] synthase III